MYNVKWYIKPLNFGDVLTPHILDYFNIKYTYVDDVNNANMISTGSVARLATDGMVVLGSGVIRHDEKLNPNSLWKFVRGPLTHKNVIQCGGQCPKIFGDPALLLPLFCSESTKKYDVGIVPHYNDYKHVKAKYPNYHIINVVNNNPLSVAKEITKCRKIISSSLHGIICAHSYGIPAAWVRFSKLHGDGIKFSDHYASVNLQEQLSSVNRPIYTAVEHLTIINNIKEIFEEVAGDEI